MKVLIQELIQHSKSVEQWNTHNYALLVNAELESTEILVISFFCLHLLIVNFFSIRITEYPFKGVLHP